MVLDMKGFLGKEIEDLRLEVEKLKEERRIKPKLCIITDGVDERCKTYMRSKLKHGEMIGVEVVVEVVKDVKGLIAVIKKCGAENTPTILQLPIDKNLEEVYNDVRSRLDVDGFFSYQELIERDWDNAPCTPKGVMNFIESSYGLDLDCRNKSVVIVGRGALVGMPLAIMCMQTFGTVTVLTSKSDRYTKREALRSADVVILASGVKGSVKMSEMRKDKNVFVINVGTMFDEQGKLTTELEVDTERDNVFYTPRIGGVGILTVLSLMENVITFYKG
ncbi:MAG: tetrahydrofolate dehydrogenase/cyclohydrolase catalytic domain-containing protein [Fusobacteriaceae bacterium]